MRTFPLWSTRPSREALRHASRYPVLKEIASELSHHVRTSDTVLVIRLSLEAGREAGRRGGPNNDSTIKPLPSETVCPCDAERHQMIPAGRQLRNPACSGAESKVTTPMRKALRNDRLAIQWIPFGPRSSSR